MDACRVHRLSGGHPVTQNVRRVAEIQVSHVEVDRSYGSPRRGHLHQPPLCLGRAKLNALLNLVVETVEHGLRNLMPVLGKKVREVN